MKILRLLLLALSLWGVFFIRAHHILVLPVFVDESLHILRAQVVFNFSDAVASFLPGKLLTYYYFGLFNPQNHNALWLNRESVALLAPLSAALCFAIVRYLTRSFWAGWLVVVLYAVTPFMIFFERMALSDPFALVVALGVVYGSLLAFSTLPAKFQQPSAKSFSVGKSDLAVGFLLGLALLAKLTALPLVGVPVLAMLLLGKLDIRRLAVVYMAAGMLLLLPMMYVVYQEVAQLEDKQEVVTATLFVPEDQSRIEQIRDNVKSYDQAIQKFGEPLRFAVVFGILGVSLNWRKGAYILLSFLGIFGFIVLASAFPSTRYLTLGFPLLLILVVLAVHSFYRTVTDWLDPNTFSIALLIMAGLGIWFGVFSLGFIRDTWQNPARHHLGHQDEWEYFSHTSSGYALRAAASDLLALQAASDEPLPVMGAVGACHAIRFYLPEDHDIKLYCPYFGFYANSILMTAEDWTKVVEQTGKYYVLREELNEAGIENIDPPSDVIIGTYPRPHDGTPATLYEVTYER